jgi:hypothetical protein
MKRRGKDSRPRRLRPSGMWKHGASAYADGVCRCAICREAHRYRLSLYSVYGTARKAAR